MALSADGRYLATVEGDGTTRVIEAATGKELSHQKQEGKVNAIVFNRDGRYVATASEDGKASTVVVMEAATGNEISRLKQEGKVIAIAFSPDGRWLAVGGDAIDGTGFASVLSSDGGRSVFRTLQPYGITAVAFSPDSESVATGARDYTARIFRLDTGVEQWRFMHQATVNAIAFSENGRHLTTGSSDSTARVIEVATGKEIARMPNESEVYSVTFSPNSRWVATGSRDGTVRIVKATANQELLHVPDEKKFYPLGAKTFSAAAFSPDERYVATADKTGVVRVTETTTGKEIGLFPLGSKEINAVAFSWNGRQVATAGPGNTVRVISLAPDGAESTVRTIDLATDHDMQEQPGAAGVYAVAFSRDGRRVITGGADGKVRFSDVQSGAVTSNISLSQGEQVFVLAADPNSDRIAIASSKDGKNFVRLFDFSGRELLQPIKNDQQINALEFSPKDSRYLAIAGGDTVRVIEASTGKQISHRSYPKQWIYSVAFSGDGKSVAIGRDDGMVRVVEARTGREVHGLTHGEPVYDLAFSADDDSLLVFAGKTAYRDMLGRDDLIDEACSRLSPNLTDDQKKQPLPEVDDHETVDYDETCRAYESQSKRSTAATSKP